MLQNAAFWVRVSKLLETQEGSSSRKRGFREVLVNLLNCFSLSSSLHLHAASFGFFWLCHVVLHLFRLCKLGNLDDAMDELHILMCCSSLMHGHLTSVTYVFCL